MALGATALLVLPLRAPGLPGGGRLLDAGHALLGGALALAVLGVLRVLPALGRRPWRARWLAGALATAYLGALELVQGALGTRTASATDLLADALGAAAFLCLAAALEGRRRPALGPLAAGAALLGVAWAPVWLDALEARAARQRFPLLYSFEGAAEVARLGAHGARLERDPGWATHGAASLRVELEPGPWPGVVLAGAPGDWRGYATLVLDVKVGDGAALGLELKVGDEASSTDAYAERYNRRYELAPGTHALRVPLEEVARAPVGRRLDLGAVRWLELFAPDLVGPRRFWLDRVRLE